ncbi:uncharacterized protein [Typha latifolia]|uniref:uncharacterized protein n=1 Tax=Typha latifolia TaxID=4733 RepID=UPI003C2E3A4E
MATRRGKWHPPPAPTPRIIHLPRRTRLCRPVPARPCRNLGALIDQERQERAESLVSGRKKIDGRSDDVEVALDEIEKVRKVSGSSARLRRSYGRNFDRQVSALRRGLEKLAADEACVKEIHEISSAPPDKKQTEEELSDVEMLKRKMEGLSKGMMEMMEEYGNLLSATNSDTNSSRREGCGKKSSSKRSNGHMRVRKKVHGHYEQRLEEQKQALVEEWAVASVGSCCDYRKVVGRIMEQVRSETEQWTQMQAMVEQVRLEMQDLQSSRDLWKRRAIAADVNIRSLHAQVQEWQHRAQVSGSNADKLQKQVSQLQNKLRLLKVEHLNHASSRDHSESNRSGFVTSKIHQQESLVPSKEKEKHVLVCRVKNSPSNFLRRSPMQDIGNLLLLRQH